MFHSVAALEIAYRRRGFRTEDAVRNQWMDMCLIELDTAQEGLQVKNMRAALCFAVHQALASSPTG